MIRKWAAKIRQVELQFLKTLIFPTALKKLQNWVIFSNFSYLKFFSVFISVFIIYVSTIPFSSVNIERLKYENVELCTLIFVINKLWTCKITICEATSLSKYTIFKYLKFLKKFTKRFQHKFSLEMFWISAKQLFFRIPLSSCYCNFHFYFKVIDILHYFWSADQSKSFTQLIGSKFTFLNQ